MEIQFYTISEDMARAANDANSMSDYKQGSATEEYRKRVESVYAVVEKIKQKRPNLAEKAERMAGRYSKKLAEYYNSYYRNEASCPSVLISGAGNFPVKKKNKQNKDKQQQKKQQNKGENKSKEKKEQDKNQKQQQQKQQEKMSKENAEQMLNAAMQQEQQTQQRIKDAMRQNRSRKFQKNW